MSGWIAMIRGEAADVLQERHPAAFLLLCQIARRVRWRREPCPITGLSFGQAMVGDWKSAGLDSEKSYRHAKGVLERAGLVAFKGANRGTIASLVDQRVFRIETDTTGEQEGELPGILTGTQKGERRGRQGATKKKDRQTTREVVDALPIPLELQTDRFFQAWSRWKQHRIEIKKELQPTMAVSQLAELASWGESRAVAAILHTITRGWQGIREPEQAIASAGGPGEGRQW